MEQFSTVEDFVRGYRQHVTRTTIYLPTKLQRGAGSLLQFRIELADGATAFRGEGVVAAIRTTPGGEQMGLMLTLKRLDHASKLLLLGSFSGLVEGDARSAGSLAVPAQPAASIGLAITDGSPALRSSTASSLPIQRNEDDGPAQRREDLRPVTRPTQEALARPLDATGIAGATSDGGEQVQALGRMAVARVSLEEFEARKSANARFDAAPPATGIMLSSEYTAAWSEEDDALDFEGIGSDPGQTQSVVGVVERVAAAEVVEEALPVAPPLPTLEDIVVAPPSDALGGGVSLEEVNFGGVSAYEVPVSGPVDTSTDPDLDFDFTELVLNASANRPALSGSVAAVVERAPAQVAGVQPAVELPRAEVPSVAAAPVAAAPVAAATVAPSRLPPPAPPRALPPVAGGASAATSVRSVVPMSAPVPKPTASEDEEKPGLFGWLRRKK